MKFAREPFLLHLLSGSDTVTALDAAKALLDAGTHDANEREPCDNLAPLHVAAAWGNLAMCQLLIHYGADVKAEDIDKRCPVDVAEGQCRRFLKRLGRKRRTERSKFGKVLSFLFRCTHPATTDHNHRHFNNFRSSLLAATPAKGQKQQQNQQHNHNNKNNRLRSSCPSTISNAKHKNNNNNRKISNVQPHHHLPPIKPRAAREGQTLALASLAPPLDQPTAKGGGGQRQMPSAPPPTPPKGAAPKPRRSSSLLREAFLTDDNTTQNTTTDDELNVARLETWRTAREEDSNNNNGDEHQEERREEEMAAKDDDQRAEMSDGEPSDADDGDDDDAVQRHSDEAVLDALRHQFAMLRLDELRERLRRRNCIAGPMNAGNRRIYEAKLAHLETRQWHGKGGQQQQQQKRDPNAIKQYSHSLQRLVVAEERGNAAESQRIGRREEAQIRTEYAHSQPTKKEVSFFCYLLIDPSQLPSFASPGPFHAGEVPFRHFLSAIFYVGKGKRSRPLQHLVQASKCRDFATAKASSEQSEKLKRILALWDRGEGVISQQLFCNIHSAEAHVREGAMIDAIGVDNLTNVVRGSFPGLASRWSRKQIAEFGAFLLREAHAIFQHERCRPIRETDLED
ncbi:hypothetical protein niasHT_038485 [Heterodera trifolii]|uniref:LEM domain-containing protein n=1 Tax=Heterodera trifolii TaxID=157864 RepID=A0ABD2IQW6_9BILA